MPRLAQAVVDLKRLVKIGIVNQPLPTQSCARFFEVHTHHQAQLLLVKLCDRTLQQLGILAGRIGIVNGAGPDDNEQTIVLAIQDVDDLCARLEDRGRGFFRDGQFFFKKNRRENDFSSVPREGYLWGRAAQLFMESKDAVGGARQAREVRHSSPDSRRAWPLHARRGCCVRLSAGSGRYSSQLRQDCSQRRCRRVELAQSEVCLPVQRIQLVVNSDGLRLWLKAAIRVGRLSPVLLRSS